METDSAGPPMCARPYLSEPGSDWFNAGLPVVGYFHDRDPVLEGAGWIGRWLDSWRDAGARTFMDLRQLAAAGRLRPAPRGQEWYPPLDGGAARGPRPGATAHRHHPPGGRPTSREPLGLGRRPGVTVDCRSSRRQCRPRGHSTRGHRPRRVWALRVRDSVLATRQGPNGLVVDDNASLRAVCRRGSDSAEDILLHPRLSTVNRERQSLAA